MHIELWGFNSRKAKKIEELLIAELCRKRTEDGDSVVINRFPGRLVTSHWMNDPFIRVYSERSADFGKLNAVMHRLMQRHRSVFQKHGVLPKLQCISLAKEYDYFYL